MRKIGLVVLCLLAIYGLARAADVENPFRIPATTCTNQFIRSIAVATGAGTCASVANADLTNSSTTVNGQSCTLGSTCTVAAAAGTLTGTTLAAGVTASSLTSASGGSFGTAAFANTGTSGAAIPFLNANNTWSGTNTFQAQVTLTSTLVVSNAIGNANGTNPICFNSGTGAVTFASVACTASDSRLKTNVQPVSKVMSKLMNMRSVRFDWRDKNYGTKRQIGVIADEFEADWPELVSTDGQGLRAFDYQKFTAVLLEAIKEQQVQIDALKEKAR